MGRVASVVAVVFALGCAIGTWLRAVQRELPASEAAPILVVGLLFVVTGVVASARRPDNVIGRLLTLTGLTWLLSAFLTTFESAVLFTAGLALFPLGLAPLGHLALVFPSGRLSSRLERLLVAAQYFLALASIPVIGPASCSDCPGRLTGLDTAHGVGRAWYSALLAAVLATTVGVLTVLVGRWRAASPVARRVLLPVLPGACAFAAAYIAAILAELGLPTGLGERWALVGLALIGAAPLVFLGGLLRSHLARAGVGELIVELGEATPAQGLRENLALALGDPTLEVAYWIPERARYVSSDGSPLEPSTGPGRSVAVIERRGRHVGALVYDTALRDDPALVDAVAAAAGLAMDNERLHAEVLARLEDVRASRTRIVEAADSARRQVERDLHDGAQQRLVALALVVGMVRARLGPATDPELEGLLHQASEEARLALRELRDLAQGLHPVVLSEAGLGPALESLAERSPAPVELIVRSQGRLPEPVEAAAYFVVSEALANVAKHAQATAVTVQVNRDATKLRLEVADDGVGGAEVRPGSGLEGLADRVAALDGRLEIESTPGQGTCLRVELPCA